MSTTASPVVQPPSTTPVPQTEQQITDAYIEKRLQGKTDELPVPPPTILEVIAPLVPPEVKPETPEVAEIKATDTYLEERRVERERRRGGKQARIDALTKEKKQLEEKLAAATPAPIQEPPKEEPAKVEPAKIEPPTEPAPRATPKARPAMNDYTDVDEYQADMALWAVAEAGRGKQPNTPVGAQALPPTQTATPQPVQVNPVQQQEFDRFIEKANRFMAGHPDFVDLLNEAQIRGLTMSDQARFAITRLAVPEVAYWLAQPANDLAARALMNMDASLQMVEIGRIAERLAVRPSDFVSNAPAPGTRINGSNIRQEPNIYEITDTDEYIRERKLKKRNRR